MKEVDLFVSNIDVLFDAAKANKLPSYIHANTGLLAVKNTAWTRKARWPLHLYHGFCSQNPETCKLLV
jgi:hypothetical protein